MHTQVFGLVLTFYSMFCITVSMCETPPPPPSSSHGECCDSQLIFFRSSFFSGEFCRCLCRFPYFSFVFVSYFFQAFFIRTSALRTMQDCKFLCLLFTLQCKRKKETSLSLLQLLGVVNALKDRCYELTDEVGANQDLVAVLRQSLLKSNRQVELMLVSVFVACHKITYHRLPNPPICQLMAFSGRGWRI